MTCIVGWVEKESGDVYIGGDSAAVSGYNISTRADEKVFVNGPMIFGYTSSFRMGQILRFSFSPPKQPLEKTDYEYMCTDFIDAVASILEQKQYATLDKGELSIGTFIVGYRNNIYTVADDLQVAKQALNFHSVGCGRLIALGAMYTIRNMKLDPKRRIELALRAASEFSAGVRPPFRVLKLEGGPK